MSDRYSAMWGYLQTVADAPFEYGKHDCCLMVARALDAMHGTDYAPRLLSCYCDEAGAKAFIRLHGGIVSAVGSFLGPCHTGLPARGDATLVDTEDGLGVGLCVGASIAVAAETGVVFYPLSAAKGYWRV